MKDPVEVQLPSDDRSPVILRMKESRDSVPPALFDDLSLNFCDGPVIKSMVSVGAQNKTFITGETHVVN